MFFTYLFHAYAAWLFASAMFIWLGSVLYRTTRNTLAESSGPAQQGVGAPTPVVPIPPRPARKPRVPLTNAA